MEICDVAEKYDLRDLCAAFVHYFYCNDGPLRVGGRRHHPADEYLPFSWLQVTESKKRAGVAQSYSTLARSKN